MLVQKQIFSIDSLTLLNGRFLTGVRLGYETYGRLNQAGDNAIIVMHYFSGTSHAAGRYREDDAEPGYWDALIGPGKAIDTNRFFVLSVDSLANLNARDPDVVTTGPLSTDPATGKAYGRDFPVVQIGDFVRTQKLLCDQLGVRHLHAAVGPSMGSMQAMEWTARYSDFVDRAVCAVPSDVASDPFLIALVDAWSVPLKLDPEHGIELTMRLLSQSGVSPGALRQAYSVYGEAEAAKDINAKFEVVAALERRGQERARFADGTSFNYVARAVQLFSIADRLDSLRARYLFIPSNSDILMPPDYARRAVATLRSRGLVAEYFELQGDGGHLDGIGNMAQAADVIRRFICE